MSEPYALVKFPDDEPNDQPVAVPQSFVKDFDPSNFKRNMVAKVFWSPVDGETPTDIMREQGRVLDLTEVLDSDGSNEPLAGYYRAIVLQIAESRRKLTELGDKRIIIPTKKAFLRGLELKADKGPPKKKVKGTTKSSNPGYVSKAKLKKAVKASDSITTSTWEKKYKKEPEQSDTTDSGDEIVLKKDVKEELLAKEIQLKSCLKENKKLQEELEAMRELNRFWQRKYADDCERNEPLPDITNLATSGLQEVKEASTSTLKSKVCAGFSEIQVMKQVTNTASLKTKIPSGIHDLNSKKQATTKEQTKNSVQILNAEEQFSTCGMKDDDDAIFQNDDAILLEEEKMPRSVEAPPKIKQEMKGSEEEFVVTPEHLQKTYSGVKAGRKGDATFAKNLASAVFSDEVLMRSSWSGNAAQGGKKKVKKQEESARPALSSVGKNVLEALFVERIKKEVPPPSEGEIQVRTEIIPDAVRHKIKYLRSKYLQAEDEDKTQGPVKVEEITP